LREKEKLLERLEKDRPQLRLAMDKATSKLWLIMQRLQNPAEDLLDRWVQCRHDFSQWPLMFDRETMILAQARKLLYPVEDQNS